MKKYGYIRVSTKEQNIDRQVMAFEKIKLEQENIYTDYLSGKNFDRPAYRKLTRRLKQGDKLYVKSIDRLGRNYTEILNEWRFITKTIGADIEVLDMDLLNTENRAGNLTGTLIADIVLQLLAYVAETERNMIHERQAEGILAARLKGVKFGRPRLDLPPNFAEICEDVMKGVLSMQDAATKTGMNRTTFYRRYCEWKSHAEDS